MADTLTFENAVARYSEDKQKSLSVLEGGDLPGDAVAKLPGTAVAVAAEVGVDAGEVVGGDNGVNAHYPAKPVGFRLLDHGFASFAGKKLQNCKQRNAKV